MEKSEKQEATPEKKSYVAPRLATHGDVAKLTQSGNSDRNNLGSGISFDPLKWF